MPGKFYIEGKKEKLDISSILEMLEQIKGMLAVPAAIEPVSGSTAADWETAEAEVVLIGAPDTVHKVHSLILDITGLMGTITIRLYTEVDGVERQVYSETFTAAADGPGLWIINGSLAIYGFLWATLESDNAADNAQPVGWQYMLEGAS